jgi:predicted component of type VI protein secretion system
VIAVSVIAIPVAGKKLAACSSAKPIAAINRPPRDVRITVTTNANTADA